MTFSQKTARKKSGKEVLEQILVYDRRQVHHYFSVKINVSRLLSYQEINAFIQKAKFADFLATKIQSSNAEVASEEGLGKD